MPVTPFHFGPGGLFKAIAPASFSFTVFAYAQVVTDLESAFYLTQGASPVHRFLHTYLGATVVGLFCTATGPFLGNHLLRQMHLQQRISWATAFISAFIGSYSHVLIDSIMHDDMTPFAPFSEANAAYRIIERELLVVLCLLAGVVASIMLLRRANRHDERTGKP